MLMLNQVTCKNKINRKLDVAADLSRLKRCSRSAPAPLTWAESSGFELGAMAENAPARSASSVGAQLAGLADGLTTLEILGNISNSFKCHIVACRGPLTADSICIDWMKPFFSMCFTTVKTNTWNDLVVSPLCFESRHNESVSLRVIFRLIVLAN